MQEQGNAGGSFKTPSEEDTCRRKMISRTCLLVVNNVTKREDMMEDPKVPVVENDTDVDYVEEEDG